MTPRQLEIITHNHWLEYRRLIEASKNRLAARYQVVLSKLANEGALTSVDKYYKDMYERLDAELLHLERSLKSKTVDIFEAMQAQQAWWLRRGLGRKNRALFASYSGFSTSQAIALNRMTIDVGKRIEAHINKFNRAGRNRIASLTGKLEEALKAGMLTGGTVKELVREMVDAAGLQITQKGAARGIASDMRRIARTQLSAASFEMQNSFGKVSGQILGLYIMRGVGPCPTGICGDALGVGEGETAAFLYGINDPPSLPIHPNCVCTVLGYIIQGDEKEIQDGLAHFKNMRDPNKLGDWSFTQKLASQDPAARYAAQKEQLKKIKERRLVA